MDVIHTAYKYLKRYPMLSIAVLSSTILASVFDGASFGMLIPLIKSMTNSEAGAIPLIFIFLFFIIVAKNIFLYFANIFIAKLRFGATRDLSASLMEHLIEYDLSFFDTIKSGHIISSLTNETRRMGDFISAVLNFTALFLRISAYIVLLFLIAWKASLIILTLVLIVLLPLELIMKKLKKIGERISHALAEYNFKLTEILNGIRLIRGSGTEGDEGRNFAICANAVYRYQYASNKYIFSLIPISEISIFGLLTACFLIMINVIRIDIPSAFPFIATYLVVLTKALSQLNPLNSARSNAINNLAAFENYENLYCGVNMRTIRSGHEIIRKFSDFIEFKDVGFSYVDGNVILRNITLKIPKGKITAIVGISGVGKSTLINLVMRFYDINSGHILVDGIDLKNLDLKEWRKKIGFVSQDIFIFNASVKDNIAYGHFGISEERIVDAAKAANAHDFITALKDGYGTILGERGVRLSGGQKQRISIARAIIHNPEILILDEATSSLDTETEKLITEAVDRLAKGRTVIAIAHRLSTVAHADNIVVLHEGRIVGSGTHSDLIKSEGLYKRLYDAQFNLQSIHK